MKCLRKYQWVKLPRDIPDMGKGLMAYWAMLASRAAFRKGNASYCGHSNPVAPGMWAGGVVGLKSILGAKSRAKALQILDKLSSLGFLKYSLDSQTKKLTYEITDWVVKCSGAECMSGAVYASTGYGFLCLPRSITQRLADAKRVFDEADAWLDLWCHTTYFIPVKNTDGEGLVIVKGLEDDAYTVTEVRTDNGYTLLKDNIKIVISQVEATELCDIYSSDLLGLVQNDPRYTAIIKDTGNLKNMPQPHLEHHLLTASATVDSKDVNMLDDDGSANAIVPLKVINTRGFDLPQTGDSGTMAFSIIGILLMACAAVVIVMVFRKKCNSN